MDGPDGTISNKMGDLFLGGSDQGTLLPMCLSLGMISWTKNEDAYSSWLIVLWGKQ